MKKIICNKMVSGKILKYQPGEEVISQNGVPIRLNLDNERMNRKVSKEVINLYKNVHFHTIWIGYKKMHLGSILSDISTNFEAPKVLDLDLFYGSVKSDGVISSLENLVENENQTRSIFSRWKGSGCNVIFQCNNLVMRTFQL